MTLFSTRDHIKKFVMFINSRHNNMSFTYGVENNDKLPFLDILVIREDKEFTTNIYCKPAFSGLYCKFHSFLLESYKTGFCYLFWYLERIPCLDWSKIHTDIIKLRNILIKNNFPSKFIDQCKNCYAKKVVVPTVPKKVVNISIPFFGQNFP